MSKLPGHLTLSARLAEGLGLNRVPWLKQAMKSCLYTMQDPFQRGVKLNAGGVAVRVPPRFARPPWIDYETVSMTHVAQWLAGRPDACLLDIGCSVGLYSLLTLATSPRTAAYAFDSDLVSLKATAWLCRHVGPDRLHLIYGFASEQSATDLDAAAAVMKTAALLANDKIPRDPACSQYVCINGIEHPGVPVNSIDQLFPSADASRPWLLKCDVEGAEMLVLKGADNFIRRARPQLLISVHPGPLQGFGFTKDDLAGWIRERGYAQRVIAIDHEEHWWCDPDH